MRRFVLTLTPELHDILLALAAPHGGVNPLIEDLLRAVPQIESERKKRRLKWSKRRKVGKPSKKESANV